MQDFTTPDRPMPKGTDQQGPGMSLLDKTHSEKANTALVTPPESALPPREHEQIKQEGRAESPLQRVATGIDSPEDNKHVRFNKEGMEPTTDDVKGESSLLESPSNSSTASQRGFVSRRGGRCNSPGRNNVTKAVAATPKDHVLEVKTYRSPPRRDSDNVPSLCSANSEKAVVDDSKLPANVKKEDPGASSTDADVKEDRPASISCDASLNQTSPLAGNEGDQATTAAAAKLLKPKSEDGKKGSTTGPKKNNVTFSPVPPPKLGLAGPVRVRFFCAFLYFFVRVGISSNRWVFLLP